MSRVLAVDLGDARTGIAICDRGEILSRPLGVIHSRKKEEILQKIVDYVKTEDPAIIVIGHPLNMDGSHGSRAQKSEEYRLDLKELLPEKEILLWDERLTTVSATYNMNQNNIRGQKRKNQIDAEAASILLESYLLYRKNQKKD